MRSYPNKPKPKPKSKPSEISKLAEVKKKFYFTLAKGDTKKDKKNK